MNDNITKYVSAVATAGAAFIDLCGSFGFETVTGPGVRSSETPSPHARAPSIGGRVDVGCVVEFYEVKIATRQPWRIAAGRRDGDRHLLLGDEDLGFVECSPRFDTAGNVAVVTSRAYHDHWDKNIMVVLTADCETKP